MFAELETQIENKRNELRNQNVMQYFFIVSSYRYFQLIDLFEKAKKNEDENEAKNIANEILQRLSYRK